MKIAKTIWLLISLSVGQTLVIIYLATTLNQLNETIHSQSRLDFTEFAMLLDQVFADSHDTFQKNRETLQVEPNVDILRQAIQQELNQYFSKHEEVTTRTMRDSKQASFASDPKNLELVEQHLDVIIAEGEISSRTMDKFSFEVSKLAPSDRRYAFSRLAKAINGGQVKNVN